MDPFYIQLQIYHNYSNKKNKHNNNKYIEQSY